MKIIVHVKDIKEVQRTALKYYSVRLSEDQTKKLILENKYLLVELLNGGLDTMGREALSDALVETILGDTLPEVFDDMLDGRSHSWHWPLNGSSDEYVRHFFNTFAKAAKKKKFVYIAG